MNDYQGKKIVKGYQDKAHRAGWKDGLNGNDNKYPKPVNDYQKVYNMGYKSGVFFSDKDMICKPLRPPAPRKI